VALLVPHRARAVHRAYAGWAGFFWLPCPLCGQPFGGHEAGGIIDAPGPPGSGRVICPTCTRARSKALR
jgi:hypothetical protein